MIYNLLMKMIILSLLILSGCSYFKAKSQYPFGNGRELVSQDYAVHMSGLSDIYVDNNKDKINKISVNRSRYLKKIYSRIKDNNENLFRKAEIATFYIVNDRRSFYFSLPGGKYFFSKALFEKYLKGEDLFVTILISEMIRSEYLIYNKINKVPFRDVTIEDLIKTTYISLENRSKINSLTYEVMARSGFDPASSLLWVQMKNRNTAEFNLQYENSNIISKEEYMLKNYIVSKSNVDSELYEKNSSREFYKFKNYLRRKWK